MSHKHIREEGKINSSNKNLPVVSKCLAIVLIPKTRRNSSDNVDNDETHIDSSDGNVVQSSEVQKALSPSGYNGKELLQDFKIRNKTCYWNPSLVESIKSLEYKGFVEPSTILVTGGDIHLENLRSAWGRRVLKAPAGFTIERIGDVNGIQMQVIPQTQFMPLPDALCSIIMDLNMRRIMATLDVIQEKLSQWYKDMTVPSENLVFETLGNLIKERKVFHTGSGYFVVTPDTNRLQNSNSSYLPTNASWLPYHPMYVPVFQGQIGQQPPMLPSRAHMRSISCQVTTIEESSEEEDIKDKIRAGSSGKSSRTSSLARNNNAKEDKKIYRNLKVEKGTLDDIAELKRSSSIKYKGEKGKAVKDINLKSSNINQEKEKGEKTSLFSKIFGRKKKDKDRDKALMPPPPPPPHLPPPPPASSTATVHSDARSDATEPKEKEYATFSAQFPPPEWLWYQQQLEKQKRTETWVTDVTQQVTKVTVMPPPPKVTARPPTGARFHSSNDHHYHNPKKVFSALSQQENVDYVAMNGIKTKRTVEPPPHSGEFLKPRPMKSDHLYDSYRNPTKHRHHSLRKHVEDKRSHRQSEYDVIDQADVTPLHESNVYHSVSALSPVAHLSDESTYAKLVEQPKLGPLHSTPRYEGQNDRTAYRVEGHEARDRIYGPPDLSQKRKSHRSRRRQQRIYSYYGQGDDISYEYKGRLPNKNSSNLQSRDSGVNCVGLGVAEDKRHVMPVYENTPVSNKHHNGPVANRNPYNPSSNRVHFEENDTTNDLNPRYMTDPALCSVVYQSDVTNMAYNSVVYGNSVSEQVGGPSVMYHTITNSNLEVSEMPPHHRYIQNGLHDDSSMAGPPPKVITFRAEINPNAPTEDQLVNTESIVDVGSPPRREISGCSAGVIELAAVDRSEENLADENGDGENDEDDYSDENCTESEHESDEDDKVFNKREDFVQNRVIQELQAEAKASDVAQRPDAAVGLDNVVLDSGFSSPRNPEADKKTPGHCNSASDGQNYTNNSDTAPQESNSNNTHQSNSLDTNGSTGQHTNSDINMATSSDHNSGSVAESGDSNPKPVPSAMDNFDSNTCKPVSRVKQSHSCNSIKSQSQLPHHSQQHLYNHHQTHQHQVFIHPYQPAAKIVTHPDVYNNNTSNALYIDQSRPSRVPLHPNVMLNNQKPKTKRVERPRSVDLWKSKTPNDLHRFEEEQLSKKYGVNGEFEVMGVL